MKTFVMLLTATCCFGPCLRAQTPVTLQDYRRQVLEYSYRLKQAAENAEAAYQSARGRIRVFCRS